MCKSNSKWMPGNNSYFYHMIILLKAAVTEAFKLHKKRIPINTWVKCNKLYFAVNTYTTSLSRHSVRSIKLGELILLLCFISLTPYPFTWLVFGDSIILAHKFLSLSRCCWLTRRYACRLTCFHPHPYDSLYKSMRSEISPLFPQT